VIDSANDSPPSASIVRAPALAAISGPNSRSQSGLPDVSGLSVRSSAAPSGVPNIAPSVPDSARPAHAGTGIRGMTRSPIAAARPMFTARIGFSGPRLTPLARVITSAIARPGSTARGSGGAASSVVAGSGPAWPGTNVTNSPTTSPVSVRTPRIQPGESDAMPRFAGRVSQMTSWMAFAKTLTPIRISAEATPMTMPGRTSGKSWLAGDRRGASAMPPIRCRGCPSAQYGEGQPPGVNSSSFSMLVPPAVWVAATSPTPFA
jgi:hypothetical protein